MLSNLSFFCQMLDMRALVSDQLHHKSLGSLGIIDDLSLPLLSLYTLSVTINVSRPIEESK